MATRDAMVKAMSQVFATPGAIGPSSSGLSRPAAPGPGAVFLAPNVVQRFEKHEGRRNTVYDDRSGKQLAPGVTKLSHPRSRRTIGVGFNLEDSSGVVNPEQKKRIEALGYNFNDIYTGRAQLSDAHIDLLRNQDILKAAEAARSIIPGFDQLGLDRQLALHDMVFNMGPEKVKGFRRMLGAIAKGDFNAAADNVLFVDPNKGQVPSTYATDVGQRAIDNARALRTGSFGAVTTP